MEEQAKHEVASRTAEDSFQIMDRFDDEIIEAELKNRVIDTWSYSFKDSDGRLQEGLSKVGVDEACVEMSKRGYIIREGVISMQTDPTDAQYILFQVPASLVRITSESKEILMDVVNGTKRQWIKMKLKSGQIVYDPFWYEKGAMKAARNARSRLIPSETKARILLLARQKNKTRNVDETSTGTSQAAPQSKKANKPIDKHRQKQIMLNCPRLKKPVALIYCEKQCSDRESDEGEIICPVYKEYADKNLMEKSL